jgi:hypothetical protein
MPRYLLHCMSPLLAQSGHPATEFRCPLLEVKRTSWGVYQCPLLMLVLNRDEPQ